MQAIIRLLAHMERTYYTLTTECYTKAKPLQAQYTVHELQGERASIIAVSLVDKMTSSLSLIKLIVNLFPFVHLGNIINFCFLLQMLRETEKILLRMCHDRIEPTEEECSEAVDTDYLPAYIPLKGEGARVTMSSSISLLSR